MTLGAIIAAASFAAGWLGKLFIAGRKSGKEEAAAEHLQKDFEDFKKETDTAFALVHTRIERMKDRAADVEIRQSAKFDELIKGQGLIEGQLNAMLQILKSKSGE